MIYNLICAGEDSFSNLYNSSKKENEKYIAIDGGLNVLTKLNIKIDAFFGDQDSLDKKYNLPNYDFPLKSHLYSERKDDGDLELAISWLIKQSFFKINDEIIIYNATGGRLDHYQAALNILIKYKDYNIKIIDKQNEIFICKYSMIFNEDNYKYISFFAITDTIISLDGFKYPLDNYLLHPYCNLCLSNEIETEGKININKPIIVMKTK